MRWCVCLVQEADCTLTEAMYAFVYFHRVGLIEIWREAVTNPSPIKLAIDTGARIGSKSQFDP